MRPVSTLLHTIAFALVATNIFAQSQKIQYKDLITNSDALKKLGLTDTKQDIFDQIVDSLNLVYWPTHTAAKKMVIILKNTENPTKVVEDVTYIGIVAESQANEVTNSVLERLVYDSELSLEDWANLITDSLKYLGEIHTNAINKMETVIQVQAPGTYLEIQRLWFKLEGSNAEALKPLKEMVAPYLPPLTI